MSGAARKPVCKDCGGTIHGAYCKLCEMFAAAAPSQGQLPSCWPLKSEALAVHPDQVPEAAESAKRKGVPTRFDKAGRPIFTDRGHRRDYLRAYGYHDKHAGYGD